MNKNNPRLVPYRDRAELVQLFRWFYEVDGDVDNRTKAISLAKAYTIRGHVPYAIECTAFLTSSSLLSSSPTPHINSFAKRLSHASAIIRFVNGFLDSQQTAQFAMPLVALAAKVDMPTSFVELRHACTHEALPALPELERAVREALEWVRIHYWEPELRRLEEVESIGSERISECLQSYAELYRPGGNRSDDGGGGEYDDEYDGDSDIDAEFEMNKSTFANPLYRQKDTFEAATAYWQTINSLTRLCALDPELFARECVGFIMRSWPLVQVGQKTGRGGRKNRKRAGVRSVSASLRSIDFFSPLLQQLPETVTTAFIKHCLELVVSSYKSSKDANQVFYPSLAHSTNQSANAETDLATISFQQFSSTSTSSKATDLTHATNWLRHILSSHSSSIIQPLTRKRKLSASHTSDNIPGFSFSFTELAGICASLSAPTPVLLEFLKLARANHSGLSEEDEGFYRMYCQQVEMLYPDSAAKTTVSAVEVNSKSNSAEPIIIDDDDAWEQQVEDIQTEVEPWSLYPGEWTPKPLGVL
ncbi:Las1-like-domain-containing protein [Myxozyma melibiosi]|uniref:Las1-like-domain-containing protein n=1 Tax=Myxozyma melibiosi TaxID=54550 RepID=A0ABR1FER5_9ASCO